MARRSWLLVAGVVALIGLVAAGGASAAKRPGAVSLKVRVTGLGTVRVAGASFTCRQYPCVHTFHIQKGRRIVVRASAAKGWKLTKWAGACTGSQARCSLRLTGWRIALVTFVPPGNRLNPYPVGKAVTLDGGWRVKVNSAKIDATAEVEAVVDPNTGDPANPAPSQGHQYTLVNVSLTHVGPATFPGNDIDSWLYGLSQLGAAGDVGGLYPPDFCAPTQPDADSGGSVSPGQTVQGNLCYEIGSGDASTLRLAGIATGQTRPQYLVWFALR
jgi:hypothetical protein